MSVIHKLASALERSDEVPNQLLAQEIAASGDKTAVQELVDNLANKDKAIQSDCIKVLCQTTPHLKVGACNSPSSAFRVYWLR